MRRRSLAILLLLAAPACKKEEPPASGPAPAPRGVERGAGGGGGPTRGVTDSEILIGQPAAFSGPSAGLGVEMWRGVFAAFQEANDRGGVFGRKIRLVLADDRYEADSAAAAVLTLIEKDKVFALGFGVGTPTIVKALPVVLQYHQREGLFYFSNFTGAQPQRQPPYDKVVFNIRASYYQEAAAIVNAYVAMNRKKICTYVQDDAYGTDGREGVKRALRAHGLELVADTRYPRGQSFDVVTDAQVKICRAAGADAIIMVGSYQACAAFIRDARNAGWNVPIHNVSFVGATQMYNLLKEYEGKSGKKVLTNLINTQVVPHYGETAIPIIAQYRAAMEKYDPKIPPGIGDAGGYRPAQKFSFGSVEGYVSARALLAILEKTGRELTRQSFYATAESMGQFDLGLGVPLELSPTRHQALDKVWFTVMTPEGWKHTETPAEGIK